MLILTIILNFLYFFLNYPSPRKGMRLTFASEYLFPTFPDFLRDKYLMRVDVSFIYFSVSESFACTSSRCSTKYYFENTISFRKNEYNFVLLFRNTIKKYVDLAT